MRLVTDDGRPLEKRSLSLTLSHSVLLHFVHFSTSHSRSRIVISLCVGFSIHFSINITHTGRHTSEGTERVEKACSLKRQL